MKRAISIGLFFVMSLASVQATWTFHFCGDHLQSVSIAGNGPETACCAKKKVATVAGNHGVHGHSLSQPVTSCCSNRQVEVSTDDSRTEQAEQITVKTPLFTVPVVFIPQRIERVTVRMIRFIFPPGGFAKYGAALLPFICVFRI